VGVVNEAGLTLISGLMGGVDEFGRAVRGDPVAATAARPSGSVQRQELHMPSPSRTDSTMSSS